MANQSLKSDECAQVSHSRKSRLPVDHGLPGPPCWAGLVVTIILWQWKLANYPNLVLIAKSWRGSSVWDGRRILKLHENKVLVLSLGLGLPSLHENHIIFTWKLAYLLPSNDADAISTHKFISFGSGQHLPAGAGLYSSVATSSGDPESRVQRCVIGPWTMGVGHTLLPSVTEIHDMATVRWEKVPSSRILPGTTLRRLCTPV